MTMRLEDLADDGCRFCGREIPITNKRSYMRIYCTNQCGLAHRLDLERIARIEARRDRQCVRCSQPLDLSRRFGASYCSTSCTRDDGNEREKIGRLQDKQRIDRHCARCGSPLAPSIRAGAIYCSSSCKRREINAKWRERCRERTTATGQQNEPVSCRWCRTMFVPRQTVPVPVLCSQACNMAERRARATAPPLLSCVICSAGYRPKAGCVPRRTCSTPCRLQLRGMTFHAKRSAFQCEAIS